MEICSGLLLCGRKYSRSVTAPSATMRPKAKPPTSCLSNKRLARFQMLAIKVSRIEVMAYWQIRWFLGRRGSADAQLESCELAVLDCSASGFVVHSCRPGSRCGYG